MKKVDTKQWLVLFSLVLVALIIINIVMRDLQRENQIFNYSKITRALDVIGKGELVTDRKTYYTLEKIINKYINSYLINSRDLNSEDVNYLDYYNVLTSEYKKALNKKEYEEKAKQFLGKFYIYHEGKMEADEYMDTQSVLKDIYKFDDGTAYLCKVKSSQNNKEGYIGIYLNKSNSSFYIFYLE